MPGAAVWTGNDVHFGKGQVALGGGYHWHAATFDDFSVAPA
jgi:hypothetical protein